MADAEQQLVRHVIIGTAGHVDHGKTTLIQALTGTNTDRLAEEQARGMTIDLGFAFLALPGDPVIEAGIVDVPGHERFVKNMLAGAGGVDVALLVVAADEGPMPQTREHIDILTILGVTRGVVALTKIDMADAADLAEIASMTTRELLDKTPLKDAVIVPVSAVTSEGLDDLKTALARAAATVPPRPASGTFRVPVDRVFSLPGVGTVITGTLVSGRIQTGDAISVQPQNLATRARTLQTHNQRIDSAEAGMRVAINLPGIEVAQIERGATLAPPGALKSTLLFDARVSLLPGAPRALRHRERVRVHIGSDEILARLVLLDNSAIAPGATDTPVQVACETPCAPARGERFVIRTYSPARAVGGGIVLEPTPARRYRRGDPTALALFADRGAPDLADRAYAVLSARHADYSAPDVAAALGSALDEAVTALKELEAERRAVLLPDGRFVSDVAMSRLVDTARRAAAAYHRQNPLRRAMPREGLRAPLLKAAAFHDFNVIVPYLIDNDVIVADGANSVRLPEHSVVLPPRWNDAAAEMLAVYQAARFQPPSPDNFQANYPRDVNVRAILGVLTENGELVRLADDLYLHRDAYAEVLNVCRRLAGTPEGITVGAVRDATGSSRKVILPLLEYLDSQRFTRRIGDTRTLAGTG